MQQRQTRSASAKNQPPAKIGAQQKDPKTGRPLIETMMAYVEPRPPSPPKKKPSVSKPLPWKQKPKSGAQSLDDVQRLMQEGLARQKQPFDPAASSAAAAAAAKATAELNEKRNQQALSQLPASTVSMGLGPLHMGSIRETKAVRAPAFSRDVPAATLATSHITAIGDNKAPPDGRKVIVPLQGHDPETDVISFRKKPERPLNSVQPPDNCDAFGRLMPPPKPVVAPVSSAQPTNPPPPPTAPAAAAASTAAGSLLKGDDGVTEPFDYFKHASNVPKRNLLATIAKDKARERLEEDKKYAHVDPADQYDIFGRRLTFPKNPTNINRQSMFPGDNEPVKVVGYEKQLRPLALQEREAMESFPNYIANPPESAMPKTADPVTIDAARRGGMMKPTSLLAGNASPPANPLEAFYASSVYRKLLASCGPWGLRSFRLTLHALDKDHDGILTRSEFNNACLKSSCDVSDSELTALMMVAAPSDALAAKKSPTNIPNFVLVPKLMEVLRGGAEMPHRRKQALLQAFDWLCQTTKKTSASLTLEDVTAATNFGAHPLFQPHLKGCMRHLISSFEQAWAKNRTAVLTVDEFIAFYFDMSPLYKADNDFARVIKGLHSV